MRILMDADLLLEAFLNRGELVKDAEKIWELIQSKEYQEYNEFYVTEIGLEKIYLLSCILGNADIAEEIILTIKAMVQICHIDYDLLQEARSSHLTDFESAVEVICVNSMKLDLIVTQNPSNFNGVNFAWSASKLLELLEPSLKNNRAKIKLLEKALEKDEKPSENFFNTQIVVADREKLPATETYVTPEYECSLKVNFQSEQPENLLASEKNSSEWKDFEFEYLELLNSTSSSGLSLFAFITRILRQFHLDSFYSEAYILNEVYLRAFNQINKNRKTIRNPAAWVKAVSFNIVRELKREQSKAVQITKDFLAGIEPNYVPEPALENELTSVITAYQMLEPKDRRLLELRVINGLPWRDISKILSLEEEQHYTEATLRKRKERTLKKLREIYLSLAPETDLSKI